MLELLNFVLAKGAQGQKFSMERMESLYWTGWAHAAKVKTSFEDRSARSELRCSLPRTWLFSRVPE
jgi:hypothetical protein